MKNGETAIPSPSKAKRRSLLRVGSWPSPCLLKRWIVRKLKVPLHISSKEKELAIPSLLRKQEVTIPSSCVEGGSAHPSYLLGRMEKLLPCSPQVMYLIHI